MENGDARSCGLAARIRGREEEHRWEKPVGNPVPSERGLGLGSQQGTHVGNRRGVWVRGTQGRSVQPVPTFGEYEIIRKLKNAC